VIGCSAACSQDEGGGEEEKAQAGEAVKEWRERDLDDEVAHCLLTKLASGCRCPLSLKSLKAEAPLKEHFGWAGVRRLRFNYLVFLILGVQFYLKICISHSVLASLLWGLNF
jgi:hypothetical protein